MNKIGAMTNHPPSMLYDIRHQLPTEVDFLSGAIAREASQQPSPTPANGMGGHPRPGLRNSGTGEYGQECKAFPGQSLKQPPLKSLSGAAQAMRKSLL